MPELINSGDPTTEEFARGPDIGDTVPDFQLPDQFGTTVRFSAVRGGGQALILFYRSASW